MIARITQWSAAIGLLTIAAVESPDPLLTTSVLVEPEEAQKALRRGRSCAIVLSSGSLVRRRFGKWIDRHDHVRRLSVYLPPPPTPPTRRGSITASLLIEAASTSRQRHQPTKLH